MRCRPRRRLVDGTNAPGSEGIAVDGHSDVRIVSGTIRDFRFNGVALRNSKGSVVAGLAIRQIGEGGQEGEDVSAGILVDGSDDVQLQHDSVANAVTAWQSDGIDVLGSEGVRIEASDVSHNAWNGLVVVQSQGARVTGNRTAGNQNSGISVFDSPSVIVAGNVSSDQVNPDTAGIALLLQLGHTRRRQWLPGHHGGERSRLEHGDQQPPPRDRGGRGHARPWGKPCLRQPALAAVRRCALRLSGASGIRAGPASEPDVRVSEHSAHASLLQMGVAVTKVHGGLTMSDTRL